MKKNIAHAHGNLQNITVTGGETVVQSLLKNPKTYNGSPTAKKQIEHLTPREIEVLQFVAEGKLNKEVASELRVSIKTIEKHREHLMKKLGIHRIAGLTHFAIYAGIIQCNPQLAMA